MLNSQEISRQIVLQKEKGINILLKEVFHNKHQPASRHFAEGGYALVFDDNLSADHVIKKAQIGRDSFMLTEAVAIERITGNPVDITFTDGKNNIEIAVPKARGSKVTKETIHRVQGGERLFVKSIGQAILNAHKKGVVVGDIKPDQFLIKEDGQAELIDYSSGMIYPEINPEELSLFKSQVEAIDMYVNWYSKISTNSSTTIKRFCDGFDKIFDVGAKPDKNIEIQKNELVSFFEDARSALLPVFGKEKYQQIMEDLKKDIYPELKAFDLRGRKTKKEDDLHRTIEITRRRTILHDSLAKWRNLVTDTQKILEINNPKHEKDFNISSKAAEYVADKTAQFLGFSDKELKTSLGFPITFNLPTNNPSDTTSTEIRYESLIGQLKELQNIYILPHSSGVGSIKIEEIFESYRKAYLTFLIEDWNQMLKEIEAMNSNGQIQETHILSNMFKNVLQRSKKYLDEGKLDEVADIDSQIAKYIPK